MSNIEVPTGININNIDDFIIKLETSKQEIFNTVEDKDVVNRLILLSQTHNFFLDLKKYYKYMQLSNQQIEYLILNMDDLIDDFEDILDKTSSNKLKNDYYKKADEFYTLLVNCQVELGFYLSDKQYS